MSTDVNIAIIGGGIGGMTLAAALQKLGVEARVFEKSDSLSEVGAGLGFWSNAVRVMQWLGLGERVVEVGQEMVQTRIFNKRGDELKGMNLHDFTIERGLSALSYIMHRGELLEMIASAVDPARVTCGAACVSVTEEEDHAVIRFDGHDDVRARMVVGADGLWSRVRASLHGEVDPRYAGEPCWRGIVARADLPDPDAFDMTLLCEVQGDGQRFGVCPMSEDRIYWWATHPAPRDAPYPLEGRSAHLSRLFAGWPKGIPTLVSHTPDEDILVHDLFDRPALKTWSRGVITLLGDAAHPTTPNLGQGACMAVEDAALLARLIATGRPHREVFERYERARRPRCNKIVKQSRLWGRLGQWDSSVGQFLREKMYALSPDVMARRTIFEHISHDVISDELDFH